MLAVMCVCVCVVVPAQVSASSIGLNRVVPYTGKMCHMWIYVV